MAQCLCLTPTLAQSAVPAGQIVGWGNNEYGQATVPVAARSGVTAVAVGVNHTVALKSDGTIVAWGEPSFGKTVVPPELGPVKAVAAGHVFTMALRVDDSVMAWGEGSRGQTTVPFAAQSGVVKIAAGYEHAAALKTNGVVVAWGRNLEGQATVPAGLAGVTAIAAGGSHTVALKSDGTVVVWGASGLGPPAGLTGVVAIAAGGSHSVGLKSDGTVVAWGGNSYGQVTGTPTLSSPFTANALPVLVGGKVLSNVVAVAAGAWHTVALKSDGTVVAWGRNSMGETTIPDGLKGVLGVGPGSQASHTVVIASVAPIITSQPASQTVAVGQNIGISVAVSGTAPFSYQWRKDGTEMSSATNATYSLFSVQTNQAGSYTVVVSNTGGSTTSAPPAVLAVNRLSQSISFGALPGKLVGDSPLTLSATAGSGLPVSYSSSNPAVATTSGNTVTVVGAGTTTITVSQAGDATYLAATPVSQTLVVSRLSQAISFGALPGKFVGDAPLSLGATASSGLPVSYNSSNPGVATVSGNTVTIVGVGSTVITATQAGDATYQPANPVPQTFTVSPVGAAITTPPQSQTVNSGATVSFTVSASGTAALAYQWRTNGVDLAGATNQSLTLTNVTTANAGSYTVRVSNAGGSVVSDPAMLTVFNITVDGLAAGSSIFRPGPALVAVSSYFPGGFSFYTLDGSTPTTSSTLYSGPFTLPSSATVRVLALSSDFLQSVPGPAVAVQIVPFYSVSLTTPGGGSAAVSPAQASYPSNSVVMLTATPDAGWTFLRWEGDATSTNHPLTLTVNAAQTVRAIFGTPVVRSAVGGGAVEFEPERAAYDFGSRLRAKALPNAGNKFVVWSGALSGITNGLDLTVTQPGQTVSALFTALAGDEVSLVALPVGPGSVTLNPHKNAYTLGELVQLVATAEGTNQFLGWTGDLSGTTSPVDVTMNASKRMTAFFGQPVPPVILTQPQDATVLAGTNLTLAVEASGPPLGFQWFHRGQSLAGATNTTLSLPSLARAQGGTYYVQVTNFFGSTNSSNAVVRVLAPTLFLPPEFTAGNPLRLRFGENGLGGVLTTNDAGNFEVHVSTNAVGTNWLRLNVPLTVTNGQIVFEDGESASLPRRFYRVIER